MLKPFDPKLCEIKFFRSSFESIVDYPVMANQSFAESGLPKELYDGLLAIVEKYNSNEEDRNQVVVLKDEIMNVCTEHKFCKPRTFHVKELAPHPSNRDGEGLSATRGQTRVKVIKKGGCSLKTLRPNCVAIEDDPESRHVAKFGCDVVAGSDKFAKLQFHDIKAGTLGAGHATQGFAMLHDEVPCDIPEISEGGRMSKSICFKDKTIKDIVENGIEFDVLDYRIERAFKIVPHIVQSALNVVQQVSEGESWHQMLLKVANAAKAQAPKYDWKQIKKDVLRTQPPRPQDVPDMVDWVAKWGGLPDCQHVRELSELCSASVSSDRVVPGSLFKSMVDIKCTREWMPAEFMASIVYVCAVSDKKIQDGVSRYISHGDVSPIGNKNSTDLHGRVKLANTILQRWHIMLDANKTFPKHRRLAMTCDLKVACVEAALARKGSPEERDLPTIAAEFVKAFQAVCEGTSEQPAGKKSGARDDATPSNNAVEYDDTGAANIGGMMIAQKNFDVAQLVCVKGDKDRWNMFQISNIDERSGSVELKNVNTIDGTVIHDSLTKVDCEEFLQKYTDAKHNEIKIVETYPSGDPRDNTKLMHDISVKGAIADALTELHSRHACPHVRIYMSPQRVVRALQNFDAGSLVLVPITPNIKAVVGDSSQITDVHVLVSHGADVQKFALTKYETTDFVGVFWHVVTNVVHEVEKANCAFELRDAKCKGVHFGARNSNTETVYSLPCIVNTKAISKHETLTLYRDKPADKSLKREADKSFTLNTAYVKKPK
jgi:hypothetical protein